MRRNIRSAYGTSTYATAFAATMILVWGYFAPIFAAPVSAYAQLFEAQFSSGSPLGDYYLICARTLAVALFAAVLIVWSATFAAAAISRSGKGAHFLYIGIPLLLPYFLGDSTDGLFAKFLTEAIGGRIDYFSERLFGVAYVFLLLLLGWKDGLLIVYTMTFVSEAVPKSVVHYAKALGLGLREWVRDILWPMARPAAVLLCLFVFVAAEHEYIATFLSMRPSPGTGTELTTHWMSRVYTTLVLSTNSANAIALISASGVILLLASLAIGAAGSGCLLLLINLTTSRRTSSKRTSTLGSAERHRRLGGWLYSASTVALIVFAVFPAAVGTYFLVPTLPADWSLATYTVPLSLAVGFVGTILGWILAFVARMMADGRTNNVGAVVRILLILLSPMIVPPFLVGLCGFAWWSAAGAFDQVVLTSLWGLSQLMLVTPLIASFLFASFLGVSDHEIGYQRSIGANTVEVAKYSFVLRYFPQLAFGFVFAFLQIWNEDAINSVFENVIPTFSALIDRTLSGRSESIEYASGYAYFGMVVAVGLSVLWSAALASFRGRPADA